MMDLATIERLTRKYTREARKAQRRPAVWQGTLDGFRVPFLGTYVPKGWKRTARKPLFVDISGFGAPNEPALTTEQFAAAMRAGYGYALIEVGQFQGYVAEYIERRTTP